MHEVEVVHPVRRPFRLAPTVVRLVVRVAVQYAPVARMVAVVVVLAKTIAVLEVSRSRLAYG